MLNKFICLLLVILLLIGGQAALAQSGTPSFPTALNTECTLFPAKDGATAKLKGSISSSATTLTLDSAALFPSCGSLRIDNRETVFYTGKSGNTITGVTRGREGTAAIAHAAGVRVEMPIQAVHHNVLSAAIRALEAKQGYSASTPSIGMVLKGTGVGTSAWSVPLLDDNSDVTITSPQTNDVLKWNGTAWVNGTVAGNGTVTSVAAAGGGIFGFTGTPITGTGTLQLTVTGTSGGIPYFSAGNTVSSSGALAAGRIVLGGGAGSAPTALAFGTANQLPGMNAAGTAYEHKSITVSSTGSDVAVAHSANLIDLRVPDASGSARGVVTTGAQTFGGVKTFAVESKFSSFLEVTEVVAPSTPATNRVRLYAKDKDGASRLYVLGDDGAESEIGAGLIDPMTTRGDLVFRNSSNVTARLQRGVAREFLVSDGLDIGYRAIEAADLPSLSGTYQPTDADLTAVAALGSTGFAARTASNTWAQRSLQQPAAGLTITNPAGIAGDPTFALANDLSAIEGLGSTGFAVRTGSDAWAQRSIADGAGLTWTNGSGLSGNPTGAWSPDTFVNNVTLWNGANSSRTLTANLSGTDPVITFTSGAIGIGSNVFTQSIAGADPLLPPFQVGPLVIKHGIAGSYSDNTPATGNIYQFSSWAEGLGTAPVVGVFGFGVASGAGSLVWGGNFGAYANHATGTAHGLEINNGVLVSGGISHGIINVYTGTEDSAGSFLHFATSSNGGKPKDGIVFANNGVDPFQSTGSLIKTSSTVTIQSGVDFSSAAISGQFLYGPNNSGISFRTTTPSEFQILFYDNNNDSILARGNLLGQTAGNVLVGVGNSKAFFLKDHNNANLLKITEATGKLEITTGTATATAGAATLNKPSGQITSESLTTAAGSFYTLTVTNSLVTDSSQVFAHVYHGTTTNGQAVVFRVVPQSGSFVVIVKNEDATNAFNGTLKFNFLVVN